MNNSPLVCICIPNYNNEKTIGKTLDSLVSQTYSNIIIKVFDNSSTDDSIMILEDYARKYSNIKIFQNEINLGAEQNFNKCIENLEGDFGALFHSDDVYMPTIIEEQVKFLIEHKDCVAVSTDKIVIDEDGYILEAYSNIFPNSSSFFIVNNQLEMLKIASEIGNFIVCPSVMMRTNIYKNKIIKYDFSNFNTASDFDAWFRASKHGKFGIILKPLIKYRKSLNSYSFRNKLDINESDGIKVLRYYYEQYCTSLSNLEKRKYSFYLFKDEVTKTVNQILINDKSNKFEIKIFNLNIFLEAINSKKNFQFYIVGFVVKFLRYFSLPIFLRNKLIDIKFYNRKNR